MSGSQQLVADVIGRWWWLPLLRGILLILLGIYALLFPDLTVGALATLIGIFVIVDGVIAVLTGLFENVPSRGWMIGRGILGILIGVFVVANPLLVSGITATFLLYILAFTAILIGVLQVVGVMQDRQSVPGAGWFIWGGAITVLFGLLILIAPITFGLLIVRILGLFAIFSGISLVAFAFRIRRITHANVGS